MMTSSNVNLFRVTGHLCGELTGHRRIPHTQASDAKLWCFLWSAINGWVNDGEADDLRRHRAHYDITGMQNNFKEFSYRKMLYVKHFWSSKSEWPQDDILKFVQRKWQKAGIDLPQDIFELPYWYKEIISHKAVNSDMENWSIYPWPTSYTGARQWAITIPSNV